jgi:hypothetical protein
VQTELFETTTTTATTTARTGKIAMLLLADQCGAVVFFGSRLAFW